MKLIIELIGKFITTYRRVYNFVEPAPTPTPTSDPEPLDLSAYERSAYLPKPREPKPVGSQPRKLQLGNISPYKSLGIEFYEPLLLS